MTQSKRRTTMSADQRSASNCLVGPVLAKIGRALIVALALALPAATAHAHSFSLAVLAGGEDAVTQLNSAVKGILLATKERDGHADETSDGHLGGLDVFIVPLPTHAAENIRGLKRISQTSIDIVVLIGPEAGADLEKVELNPQSIVVRPGTINTNPSEASGMFAKRFETEYGTVPDQWAAEGYNAARRIDLAVRPLGGVDDRRALIAALAATEKWIEW